MSKLDRDAVLGLLEDWRRDAAFDNVDLDREALRVPELHARYLRRLSDARPALEVLRARKRRLNRLLHEYYKGDLNEPEELRRIGRDPFVRKVLRGDVQTYVDGDPDMSSLDEMIAWHQEYVDSCREILRQINDRNWHVRNAIEHRRLTQFSDDR